MKNLIEYIEEGLLSGEDTVLNQGDAVMDKMCLFHWRFGKSHRYKVYKNVDGGLGMVFKKHFIKKPVTLYTYWTADPISKHPNDAPRFVYERYNIDYLYAIILNTKLPKPIESYNIYTVKDSFELSNAIEQNLRSYMTDEWKNFRTEGTPHWPVLSVSISPKMNGIKINIYYHQNDIKYRSQLLCDLEFIENK